tara:strand:+ start:338 stop:775 length:438 start_codon:yes stop_codon:yes gene_type:complete
MAKEFSRSQRVGDHLQQELARLIQLEVRDPRAAMVSVTGVEVSRDMSYARVFFTKLGIDDAEQAKETMTVLNKAAGFLRSKIASSSSMRTVPKLSFRFDESVGYGRTMEMLLRDARAADGAFQSDDAPDIEDRGQNDSDTDTAAQ